MPTTIDYFNTYIHIGVTSNPIIVFKISAEKGKGTGEVIKSLNPNLCPRHDFDSQSPKITDTVPILTTSRFQIDHKTPFRQVHNALV